MSLNRELAPDERPRVLVVDDESDISETVAFCLDQEGYEVKTASNGFEALGVARAWNPHLILLDVMMPGENGYRVCRLVKEDEARGHLQPTIVYLVTARKLDDPEREQAFAEFSRADGVIYKPFDMDALVEIVRSRIASLAVAPA
jgi:CheY-like chemotaxis protein